MIDLPDVPQAFLELYDASVDDGVTEVNCFFLSLECLPVCHIIL